MPFGIETAAGVRYVQFAQPFAQQLGKVIIIVDMGQEAAIGGGHLVPVHSVHIGIVESLLLLAVHVSNMYSRSAAKSILASTWKVMGVSASDEVSIFCILRLPSRKRLLPSLSSCMSAHPASILCSRRVSFLRRSIFQRSYPPSKAAR
mgnify:CR=1 FL=1